MVKEKLFQRGITAKQLSGRRFATAHCPGMELRMLNLLQSFNLYGAWRMTIHTARTRGWEERSILRAFRAEPIGCPARVTSARLF